MSKEKELIYLIGDFRRATVFVGEGFLFNRSEDPADFEKPVNDVEIKGRTYRFWNADPKFHKDLAARPNTFLFSGDLNGMMIQIDNDGTVHAQHLSVLEREP